MASLDFLALFAMCAPQVHPATLQALIAAESDFQVFALHVNGDAPQPTQPTNRADAAALLTTLLKEGKSVDAGLGQINSKNFDVVGLTPETAFDPCRNISATGQILTSNYDNAAKRLPSDQALQAALSAYNTGNESAGIKNGYVQKVQRRVGYTVPALAPAKPLIADQQSPVKLSRAPRAPQSSWSPFERRADKAWDVYDRQ